MVAPVQTLAMLWKTYHAEPIQLVRTREGRNLSRERFRRAEEFMTSFASGDWFDCLYHSGIVAQLALSSYLLDVGFPDAWCARHVGLYVARSLAYANATGFGHDCDRTARLAQVLTPYWKWNRRQLMDASRPSDDGFTATEVQALLHALIDHVGEVTGHGFSSRRAKQRGRFSM
jgi:hypothetical protein